MDLSIFNNLGWITILEAYLLWVIVYFILKIAFNNTRILKMVGFYVVIYIIYLIVGNFDMPIAYEVFRYLVFSLPLFIVVIAAPDLRLTLESMWKSPISTVGLSMGSDRTKNEIIQAVLYLSKEKIGALITLEKHHSLDQYSGKAIVMNSDITKELLINIFTPNTPLHDGGVIIRGNKIVSAGAYFVLTSNEMFERTTGSRHRAALGVSEVTDSLTIVVSEETGNISIALNGVLTKMKDEDALSEYLSIFMR